MNQPLPHNGGSYFKHKYYGKQLQSSVCSYLDDFIWYQIMDYAIDDGIINQVAIQNGDHEYIDYLMRNGIRTSKIIVAMVRLDKLNAYIYIHEKYNYTWDEMAVVMAISNIKFIKYLHETAKCPWNGSAMDAAGYGHYDALVYLHENGCPWGLWTYANACMNVRNAILSSGRINIEQQQVGQKCIRYINTHKGSSFMKTTRFVIPIIGDYGASNSPTSALDDY